MRTVVVCLLVTITSVLMAEWYVRKDEYQPASTRSIMDSFFTIDNCTPDRELGWVNTPGLHAPSEDATQPEVVGFNRQRRSGTNSIYTKQRSKRVAIFGCSFTYGCGVNDDETYVWKLNELFPAIKFENYGVPGYGAYQCFKSMERALNLHPNEYDAVIYAGIMDHACRDYYDGYYMPTKSDIIRYRSLYRNPQHQRWLNAYHWPGDSTLALINFFKIHYITRRSNDDIENSMQNATTEDLCSTLMESLTFMKELAQRKQTKFLFASLDAGYNDAPDGPSYKLYQALEKRLIEQKIPYHNCSMPPEYIPPEDDPRSEELSKLLVNYNVTPCHHPNGRGHNIFASKIGEWVKENLL